MVPSKPVPPSLFVLSKSDQSTTSNLAVPLVVIVPPDMTEAFPCMVSTPVPPDLVIIELLMIHPLAFEMDLRKIFPVSDEVNAVFNVITPPYIFIGPAAVIALSIKRLAALPVLPNVKERMVCPL